MDGYQRFREQLLEWFAANGRTFYWRTDELDPFEILLTELLLKRTRAETVNAYGPEILKDLSTPKKVTEMEEDRLKEILQPLGLYNRRSKNIKQVCQSLCMDFDGNIPKSRSELKSISGIGDYTADAVCCFAFEQPVVVLDTNTATVAENFFGVTPADDLRQDEQIRATLKPLVASGDAKTINWALLDLGASLINGDTIPSSCSIPVFDHPPTT